MAKTCIICGKRAGSGEHVFPAVLGGRRVNNGIYCHAHNQGFSPLAAIIGGQLKPINALLAVRPDHKDKAEPYSYTSPEGEDLIIFDGKVDRAMPDPNNDASLHVRLALGGDDGLRAVGYIALTFFAAHFQEHARKPELQPMKVFLQSLGHNEFAWWELNAPAAGLPANPFPFGHSIVLTTSAATGRAAAYVSFFGELNFGIDFGAIPALSDQTVIIFIDPHAEAAPADLRIEKHAAVLITVIKPDPLHAYLVKIVSGGLGQQAMQGLLERIEEWKFSKEMATVLDQLNASRSLTPVARNAAIAKIVGQQASCIYRLMRHIADDFVTKQAGSAAACLIPVLMGMIKTSPSPDPTFNEDGEYVILGSLKLFTRDLATRLAVGDIDMEYLFRLFSGGYGAGLVGKLMLGRAHDVVLGPPPR